MLATTPSRAILRRRAGRVDPVLRHRGVSLNPATREVALDDEPVVLTGREMALLQAFMDRPGVVLSKAQLEEKLYGWGGEVESNTVEVYINALRKKLGAQFIQNVRGVGYLSPRAASPRSGVPRADSAPGDPPKPA